MEFFCFFLPTFISLYMLNKLCNRNIKVYEYISNYVLYNILINLTIMMIVKVFFGTNEFLFTVSFSIKYIFLAVFLAVVYPFLIIRRKSFIDKEYYIDIYKSVKKWINNNTNLSLYVGLFILMYMLFLFLDIEIRNIADKFSDFYSVFHLCPTFMTLAYTLLVYGIVISLPKILSKISMLIFYVFSLALYMTHYMMLNIKEESFTVYDLCNASEAFEFFNFVIKEISVLFIITIVFSIVLFILIIKIIDKTTKFWKTKLTIVILFVSLLGFLGVRFIAVNTLSDYHSNAWDKITYPRYYYENYINPKRSVTVAGLYEYTFRDVYLYVKNVNAVSGSIGEVDEITGTLDKKDTKNDYTAKFKDKNLIMIMLESVDNLMFNDEMMPTLMKMKNEGWNFPKRYSQLSSGGSTIATEYTSLTGLFYMGQYYNINNNHYYESIPNLFINSGYQTNSVHENRGLYYNRTALHKAFGFQNSYFVLDHQKDANRFDDVQLVTNKEIYNQIVNKGNEKKFMSFIVTISSHGPYVDNNVCAGDKKTASNEYECVKFLAKRTDDFLDKLLKQLDEDKLLDDTVIVLYSDHYAYAYNYTAEDRKLYDQVDDNRIIQNLPFIIYSTDIDHEEFDNILIDDVDIEPTILNLFGIDYDAKLYIGSDVFSKGHENIVMFTDYSWYDGEIYSFNSDVDKSTEYYINTSKQVKETLDLNTMITNTDYYKTLSSK